MTESWGKNHFYKRLANGARIVVDDDFHSELVSIQIQIGVGSAAEKPDEYGCAHLLEHMLFESQYGDEHLISKIEQLGGTVNAMTSDDCTAVYTTVPVSKHLEALELLLEAVTAPILNPKKLERERQVVLNEAARVFEDPLGQIQAKTKELFFGDDPYGRHPIGTTESINALDADTLLAFHRDCYIGSKVCAVISGGAKRQEVVSICESHLSRLPTSGRRVSKEPCIYRTQVEIERHDWEFCYASIMFPGGRLGDHKTTLGLALVKEFLESRLEEALFRSELALNVATSNAALHRGGQVEVGVGFNVDKFEKVLDEVFDVVEDFVRFLFHEAEFEEQKETLERSHVHVQESSKSRALLLAMLSMLSDGNDLVGQHFDFLAELTIEEARDLVKKHLRLDRACVYVCVPKEVSEQKAKDVASKIETRLKRLPRKHGKKVGAARHGVEEVEFDCGFRLYAWRDKRLPIVSGSLAWLGGDLIESKDQAGATRLLMDCMSADELPVSLLENSFKKVGASAEAYASNSHVELMFDAHPEQADWMVQRVFEIASQPTIFQKDFDHAVESLLEARKFEKSQFGALARARMMELLFRNHPHGRCRDKNPIEQFDTKELLDLWQNNYSIDHAVLGLAGEFDFDLVIDLIGRLLAKLPQSSNGSPILATGPKWPTEPVIERKGRSLATETHISIGWPVDAQERSIKRSATFLMLKQIVGGASGYLFETIRNQHGLVYHVSMNGSFTFNSGCIYTQTETDPKNADAVLELIDKELDNIRSKPIERRDFERAAAVVRNELGGLLECRSDISASLAFSTALGWSTTGMFEEVAALEGITIEDVQEMANEVFDDRYRVTSIIEPGEE